MEWLSRALDTLRVPATEGVDSLAIEMKTWRALDDRDYGGKSECKAAIIPVSTSSDSSNSGPVAQLVFSGAVHFDAALSEATNNAKGGFCAIMGTVPTPLDLRDYAGLSLELKCTSQQPRRFTVNVAATSFFVDDLYQYDVVVMGDTWVTVHLPFDGFRLTSRGAEREVQRKADSIHLERLGFITKEPNGTL